MMKPKIHLFDGPLTLAQQLIMLFWGALLVGVIAVWAPRGVEVLGAGLSGVFLGIAQLLGLLATFFALTQFMLMGRIAWIERQFGLDRLASYHRFNGYMAISLIVIHPVFITLHHATLDHTDIISAYLSIFSEHPYTLWALIAELLFVAVVISSMYIARRHLKFETWYFVHLMVYAAIILASFHQFTNGGSLIGSVLGTAFWLDIYLFVAVNLLIWRVGLVVANYVRFQFTVSHVVPETPTVTSVYIKARALRRLKLKPGQFILVRIFTKQLWWQEHPFTVSWIPHTDELRISVRNVGDYTAALQTLEPGARVAVSGPFGRFTSDVAITKKRLFVAGGIGITPLRGLFEQAADGDIDSVLLYGNKTAGDVPLKSELDDLATETARLHYVYSDERIKGATQGRIDIGLLETVVPDFMRRDIYICGPPPMTLALIEQLTTRGFSQEQLHYEVFALHP